MNYKKIVKSRSLRQKILSLLRFVPDKTMIKLQYRMATGRKLNLKNPQRFTEKLQWCKLYYRNPLMPKCVDKYNVREYVTDCGYQNILTNCYGVYSSAKEINFNDLPNQFVIKDTLGGGGNTVLLVENKESLDLNETKKLTATWLKSFKKKLGGREWPYYSGEKNRLIIEELLSPGKDLADYKFFCFDGNVKFLYVSNNRILGKDVDISIFDRDFNMLPVARKGHAPASEDKILKPENYEEMLKIAENLSKPFPHVRVDLYNIDGKIVFGELTFFNASGYMNFEPDDFDFTAGEYFNLPKRNN